LHSFLDNFDLHQGKKCKCDHGTWGPQKTYFHAYIIYYHGPTGFEVGEAKEVLSLQMLGDYGKTMSRYLIILFFLPNFSTVTRQKGKKEGRGLNMKKIPKTAFIGHILKNQHIHIWCMVISLGPHSVYT
jgi:hypothetical protein